MLNYDVCVCIYNIYNICNILALFLLVIFIRIQEILHDPENPKSITDVLFCAW